MKRYDIWELRNVSCGILCFLCSYFGELWVLGNREPFRVWFAFYFHFYAFLTCGLVSWNETYSTWHRTHSGSLIMFNPQFLIILFSLGNHCIHIAWILQCMVDPCFPYGKPSSHSVHIKYSNCTSDLRFRKSQYHTLFTFTLYLVTIIDGQYSHTCDKLFTR